MYQCVNVSMCQRVNVSMCQCVNVSMCQRVNVSMCQCVNVSMCQCVNVSMCQRVNLSTCQCVNVSMYQFSHPGRLCLATPACDAEWCSAVLSTGPNRTCTAGTQVQYCTGLWLKPQASPYFQQQEQTGRRTDRETSH